MDYYNYNSTDQGPQAQFNTQARGIGLALKWFAKLFIYLPLLVIGYFIAVQILSRADKGMIWIGTILAGAIAAYAVVIMLKKFMLSLRQKGNALWIFLFALCIGLTCLLTPWLAYQPINELFAKWGWPHLFTWLAVIGIGGIIYKEYDFLKE